ncbi:hypothetical protein PsorP6_005349 [Peronosclerospora sorghi]|uniref:Uncharacterized protein n=1 Tax=Peronosclerospora sorghi TaxID=230839 RepID=A0ACC0W4R5_9STRA|nr:hypothetical protein PsorP6_005349 [Peronosclerospora sorghi]
MESLQKLLEESFPSKHDMVGRLKRHFSAQGNSSAMLYQHFKSGNVSKLNRDTCKVQTDDMDPAMSACMLEVYEEVMQFAEGENILVWKIPFVKKVVLPPPGTSAGPATPLETILKEFEEQMSSNFDEFFQFIDQDYVAPATTSALDYSIFN